MSKIKIISSFIAVCIVLFFVTACIDSQLSTVADEQPETFIMTGDGSVNYQLDWDLSGVTFSTDKTSWTTQSALGYTVTIRDGNLTNASVQLIDCREIAADFSLVKTASAGHGDELDPSFVSGPFIDSLSKPEPTSVGTIDDLGSSYCQGHYVVAGQNSTDLPSITLIGDWVHDESGESGIIEIETSLAWGEVHNLPQIINFADATTVTVTVTRQLGSLFDTADFRTKSESDINRALLRQLTSQAEFSVTGN